MKLALILCVLLMFVMELSLGLIVAKDKCGPHFYCPDHCNISWRDACPHNCFCGPVKYCPRVTCPASYPVCLIFTMFDGCQSCACKIPFAFLKGNESDDTHLLYRDPAHLRDVIEGQNVTDESGNEMVIAKKMMCTIDSLSIIDFCLRTSIDFRRYAVERKLDDESETINPLLLLNDRDMKTLCRLFTDAITCMGADIYQDCKRVHPDLSLLNSLLSYACGPKSEQFFQHFSCILNVHKESRRLKLCEDLFANALVAIEESKVAMEEKLVEKCKALNWYVKCGIPSVYRYCSATAADVYAESLMEATEYMAPECRPDYENGTISVKPREITNIVLTQPKEPLNCSLTHQFSIFALFGHLFQDIRSLSSSSTPAFPTAYWYLNITLHETCEQFRSALYQLPIDTRIRCYRNFEVFDQVYGVFAYPCSPETQDVFFKHFGCLKSLRSLPEIVECEEEANRHLLDPSMDQCEVYELVVRCIHGIVERECGYDAWDVHFQLLTLSVRRYVPFCTLTPVYRPTTNTDGVNEISVN